MYTDDIVLMCDSASSLCSATLEVQRIMKQWGMAVSIEKSKALVVSRSSDIELPIIIIDGQQMEVVEKCTYLGSIFTSDNSLDAEISHRISRAAGTFASFRRILWGDKHISLVTKVRIFNAAVMSALLYGSESWTVLDRHVQRLEVFHMQCLRALCGVSRRIHMSNAVILAKCGQPLVANMIRGHRLRWLGHLGRMGGERVPKRVLFGKFTGKKPRGRPRVTWADVLVRDIQEHKIGKWYKLCQDRAAWRNIIRV